jgi:hypothetical protein
LASKAKAIAGDIMRRVIDHRTSALNCGKPVCIRMHLASKAKAIAGDIAKRVLSDR